LLIAASKRLRQTAPAQSLGSPQAPVRAEETCNRSRDERVIAFSSEVDTGSREENASKQKIRASVLIQSEPKRL